MTAIQFTPSSHTTLQKQRAIDRLPTRITNVIGLDTLSQLHFVDGRDLIQLEDDGIGGQRPRINPNDMPAPAVIGFIFGKYPFIAICTKATSSTQMYVEMLFASPDMTKSNQCFISSMTNINNQPGPILTERVDRPKDLQSINDLLEGKTTTTCKTALFLYKYPQIVACVMAPPPKKSILSTSVPRLKPSKRGLTEKKSGQERLVLTHSIKNAPFYQETIPSSGASTIHAGSSGIMHLPDQTRLTHSSSSHTKASDTNRASAKRESVPPVKISSETSAATITVKGADSARRTSVVPKNMSKEDIDKMSKKDIDKMSKKDIDDILAKMFASATKMKEIRENQRIRTS